MANDILRTVRTDPRYLLLDDAVNAAIASYDDARLESALIDQSEWFERRLAQELDRLDSLDIADAVSVAITRRLTLGKVV